MSPNSLSRLACSDRLLFSMAGSKSLLLCAAAVFLASTVSTQFVPTDTDANVLLEFKGAFTNWDSTSRTGRQLQGWNETSDPCNPDDSVTNWTGVTCMGGVVTELYLNSQGLTTQQLPASLARLASLVTLDLGTNNIAGSLPPDWAAPGSFPVLTSMALDENRISGSLPPAWGAPDAFQKLAYLEVQNNRISGSIPDEFGSQYAFPLLSSMDLANNNLTGALPSVWGSEPSLPQLYRLRVNGNFMTGAIPSTWTGVNGLSSLVELHVKPGNPALCGSLPANSGLRVYTVPAEANSDTSYFTTPLNCTAVAAAPTAAPPSSCPSSTSSAPANTDQPTQLTVALELDGLKVPLVLSSADQATLLTAVQNLTKASNVTFTPQAATSTNRRLLAGPGAAAAPSPAGAAAGTTVFFAFGGKALGQVLASVVDAVLVTTTMRDTLVTAGLPVQTVRLVGHSATY
ncbi:hypothetical protein WJX72_002495 [[Myrmecia] bisecta]|uniref:Leucine-rich repeat-containing N-terminal plant-type domain-containing protein n=1 Tax=[Myrmecia] bisecta TaxID=41462 RepID=A0AAW1Q8D9_9CHLO